MKNPLEIVPAEHLRERTSIKWRFHEPDVLPMWIAELDVLPAEPVQEAVAQALRTGDTGYSYGSSYPEAVARFSADIWGYEPDVDRSLTVADVMTGMCELIRLVTEPDGNVIIITPVYPPFRSFTEYAGRTVLEAPLGADLRLDLATIEAACSRARAGGKSAALMLSNPHNQTGTVHTEAELEALAEVAARHGVTVLADEIHSPIVYDRATFIPYLKVDPAGYSVFSASKAFNLPGLRAATIFAGAGADLTAVPDVVSHGAAGHVAVKAHVAALDHGRDWLDALIAGLDFNRELLARLLADAAPTVGYRIPDATYLAWLDFSSTRLASSGAGPDGEVATVLCERARLGVNAGERFGSGGADHVRLNFGTRQDLVCEGVARLASLL